MFIKTGRKSKIYYKNHKREAPLNCKYFIFYNQILKKYSMILLLIKNFNYQYEISLSYLNIKKKYPLLPYERTDNICI